MERSEFQHQQVREYYRHEADVSVSVRLRYREGLENKAASGRERSHLDTRNAGNGAENLEEDDCRFCIESLNGLYASISRK
jgi:hypothetical protein